MPLTRYQIRNEYGLADPELYRAADKDDPEALLEGVAMAGLVGILRQLGDLAEFAAEMFHDLHEEVMATAARGHGLMVRVQQLEAEFPSIEKALLSRTDHSPFFSSTGADWHPNLQVEQGLITHGDLPHCVMDSYEECRGPPRLFLLDKFDVAGAGACLKRYTDPSFFRLETSCEASVAEIHREKKSRKAKKRGTRWKNGGTPENAPTTHAKLHELFMEERVEGGRTDPARLVKLKMRKLDGYPVFPNSGESYMGKFVQTSPDHKTGYGKFASNPQLLMWNKDDSRDSVTEIPEVSVVDVVEKSCQRTETEVLSPNTQKNVPKHNLNGEIIDRDIETVPESYPSDEAQKIASIIPDRIFDKGLQTYLKGMPEALQDRSHSEDLTSEVENYVDALATMESETETDNEGRPRNISGFLNVGKRDLDSEVDEEQLDNAPRFSDSQSIGNTSASENGYNLFEKWRSSFSYSDTASISTENDPSDREKTAGHIPSSGICESEPMSLSSNFIPANKDSKGCDSHEHESVSGSDVDLQASHSSRGTSSGPASLSQNDESHSLIDQSLATGSVEALDSARLDLKKGGTGDSGTNLVDSSVTGAPLDGRDPCFSSEVSLIELPVPVPEGSRCVSATEDTIQTDYAADCSSENLAKPETSSKLSDSAPSGEQLSFSTRLATEVSPDGVASKVGSPIRIAEIHSENTLDNEADDVIMTKPVLEVYSRGSVTELSSENSPAFGIAADESVSDGHEDALENRTVMPAGIIESTLASDASLEDNKSMADALPNSSIHTEQPLETSANCNSSYLDEGFDEYVQLDNVASEAATKEDFSLSNNGATEENTHQPSSGAGELCHKIPDSDQTLLVDYNPESERKIQTDHWEVASEGLGTTPSESVSSVPLDEEVSDNIWHSSAAVPINNDLANGNPLVLQILQDQSDTEPETKSTHQSSRLNSRVDSSVLDVCDPSEKGTPLKQSVDVRAPAANQVLAGEAILQSDAFTGLSSELVPESAVLEPHSSKLALSSDSSSPTVGLIPETTQPILEEMPPLPPLPPIQWRMGKVQHSVPSSQGESVENSKASFPAASPFGAAGNSQFRFAAVDQDSMVSKDKSVDTLSVGGGRSELLPEDYVNKADKMSPSHTTFLTTAADLSGRYESPGSERTESVNPFVSFPEIPDEGLKQDYGSEECKFVQSTSANSSSIAFAEHGLRNHDLYSRDMPSQPQNQSEADEDFKDEAQEHESQNSGDSEHCRHAKALTSTQSMKVEEEHQFVPRASDGEIAEPSNSSLPKIITGTVGDAMWPVNAFALASALDAEKPNEVPTVKLPRPRSPLVDAVAAHDRSTMRKVSERVRPPIEPKEEEKDSLLAQIRNKSFNLKPAAITRPSMQVGPKTNLKVAAILEKANTIRQAMAGSDEDDDSDTWSDS